MLIVDNVSHFAKVQRFALDKRIADKLWEQLWTLHTFFDECTREDMPEFDTQKVYHHRPEEWEDTVKGKVTCDIMYDFAPASLYFNLCRNGKSIVNGGLIYHGDQSGWVNPDGTVIAAKHKVDTFSVTLTDTPDKPWSIHT